MASAKNDALRARTVEGSINLYDDQKTIGTAADKAIAARLSGYNYNILSNKEKDEVYLRELRCGDHYVDKNNRATQAWWDRRRKFPRDQREPIRVAMQSVEDHPKVREREARRLELQLVQAEHAQDFGSFQKRRRDFRPPTPPRRYCLNDKVKKLNPDTAPLEQWKIKRSESVPVVTTSAAASTGRYPRSEQILNESASLAKVPQSNTYTHSLYNSIEGENIREAQRYRSLDRVRDYDFSVTRKNNHWSNENKLTRSDAYYLRPRFGMTHNSVKYDIITNNQRNFCYV